MEYELGLGGPGSIFKKPYAILRPTDMELFPKRTWEQHYGKGYEQVPEDCP